IHLFVADGLNLVLERWQVSDDEKIGVIGDGNKGQLRQRCHLHGPRGRIAVIALLWKVLDQITAIGSRGLRWRKRFQERLIALTVHGEEWNRPHRGILRD